MAALSNSTATRIVLRTLLLCATEPLQLRVHQLRPPHGRIVPLQMAGIGGLSYAIVYIGILLSAAVLIFQKRNFK